MHTITFYAPKGGSGRTVATMALASGFLGQGKRVAVMDCSNVAGNKDAPLSQWSGQMRACGINPPQLQVIACRTEDEVEDRAAEAQMQGIDILLIDLTAQINAAQLAALGLADLVIAPANGPLEARFILEGSDKHLGTTDDVMGLINGCMNGPAHAERTRATFGALPVFQSELPWAEALSDQIINGDIPFFADSLTRKPGKPGYARFRDAQAAWVAVQRLTFEVEWALDGHRLEPVEVDTSPFMFRGKAVA